MPRNSADDKVQARQGRLRLLGISKRGNGLLQ